MVRIWPSRTFSILDLLVLPTKSTTQNSCCNTYWQVQQFVPWWLEPNQHRPKQEQVEYQDWVGRLILEDLMDFSEVPKGWAKEVLDSWWKHKSGGRWSILWLVDRVVKPSVLWGPRITFAIESRGTTGQIQNWNLDQSWRVTKVQSAWLNFFFFF